jgi:hypothetical protein
MAGRDNRAREDCVHGDLVFCEFKGAHATQFKYGPLRGGVGGQYFDQSATHRIGRDVHNPSAPPSGDHRLGDFPCHQERSAGIDGVDFVPVGSTCLKQEFAILQCDVIDQ